MQSLISHQLTFFPSFQICGRHPDDSLWNFVDLGHCGCLLKVHSPFSCSPHPFLQGIQASLLYLRSYERSLPHPSFKGRAWDSGINSSGYSHLWSIKIRPIRGVAWFAEILRKAAPLFLAKHLKETLSLTVSEWGSLLPQELLAALFWAQKKLVRNRAKGRDEVM